MLNMFNLPEFKEKFAKKLANTLIMSGGRTIPDAMLVDIASTVSFEIQREEHRIADEGYIATFKNRQAEADAARVSELRAQIGAHDIKATPFMAADTDSPHRPAVVTHEEHVLNNLVKSTVAWIRASFKYA